MVQIDAKRQVDLASELEKFTTLLGYLHRCGKYRCLWARDREGGSTSHWAETSDPLTAAAINDRNKLDLYFGVHPLSYIPQTNAGGTPTDATQVRGRTEHVAAVGGLYADFDAGEDGDMEALLERIENLPQRPSAIINTGGGYHAYWLLTEERVTASPEERAHAKWIQREWVRYVGADLGAVDLARVLRIPGTRNYKYHPTPRNVYFQRRVTPGLLYSWDELEALLPPFVPKGDREPYDLDDLTTEAQKADSALRRLDNARADNYGDWIRIGMALRELGDAGLELWKRWSSASAKYTPGDCEDRWDGFAPGEQEAGGVTLGTLHHMAAEDARRRFDKKYPEIVAAAQDYADPDGLPSEQAEAARRLGELVEQLPEHYRRAVRRKLKKDHGVKYTDFDQLLSDAGSSAGEALAIADLWQRHYPPTLRCQEDWWRYSEGYWLQASNEEIEAELRDSIIAYGNEWSLGMHHAVTKAATLSPGYRLKPDEWNPDSNILVMKSGTLDLSDRANPLWREHRLEDFSTVALPYDYDPGAKLGGSVFERVLRQNITDRDTIRFLLQWGGFCLVGDVRHEICIMLHGPAGGGKSTVIEALAGALGDYAGTVSINDLVERDHISVILQGKRMVFGTDVSTRHIERTEMLNRLISGEELLINPKYKHPFNYRPQAGMIFATNVMPTVHSPEDGILRRIHIIPVQKRATKHWEPGIIEAMRNDPAEHAIILNQLIAGLQAAAGARPDISQVVRTRTESWRRSNNRVQVFIEQCCEFDGTYVTRTPDLHEAFKSWVSDRSMYGLARDTFVARLENLGFGEEGAWGGSDGDIRVRVVRGLRLRPEAVPSRALERGEVTLDSTGKIGISTGSGAIKVGPSRQ